MTTTLTTYRPSLLGRTVFDDIFNSMLDFPSLVNRTTQGYPVADMYHDKNGDTVLEFALAGFAREDLNIEVKPEKNSITVSADNLGVTDKERQRRVARRNFSKTYVNYDNNLDLDLTQAEYENGLLRLVIPRKAQTKSKKILIK